MFLSLNSELVLIRVVNLVLQEQPVNGSCRTGLLAFVQDTDRRVLQIHEANNLTQSTDISELEVTHKAPFSTVEVALLKDHTFAS